jgi:hypothetical protein
LDVAGGILDPERETSLDEVLANLELPARQFPAKQGTGRAAKVIDLSANGVRVTLMPHELSSTAPDRSPSRMQTMPGKSLATSLKRKRRALNNMHLRMPFACASGL